MLELNIASGGPLMQRKIVLASSFVLAFLVLGSLVTYAPKPAKAAEPMKYLSDRAAKIDYVEPMQLSAPSGTISTQTTAAVTSTQFFDTASDLKAIHRVFVQAGVGATTAGTTGSNTVWVDIVLTGTDTGHTTVVTAANGIKTGNFIRVKQSDGIKEIGGWLYLRSTLGTSAFIESSHDGVIYTINVQRRADPIAH
jgi:hypothetical protein